MSNPTICKIFKIDGDERNEANIQAVINDWLQENTTITITHTNLLAENDSVKNTLLFIFYKERPD